MRKESSLAAPSLLPLDFLLDDIIWNLPTPINLSFWSIGNLRQYHCRLPLFEIEV